MRLRRRAAVALTVALLAAGSFTLFASAGPAVAFSSGGLFLDVQVEAFIRGSAVITAEIFGCGTRICGSETDSETVRLQR